MSYWKSFGLAILAAACLMGATAGSARAQCDPLASVCATEWSGGGSAQVTPHAADLRLIGVARSKFCDGPALKPASR
jgi:hypothetical protein